MTRVLVTVGQQLPFDRLIKIADQCAANYRDWHWLAQIGAGDYRPQHMHAVTGLDQAGFEQALAESDIVMCHAGIGTIMQALALRRPVLVMARDAAMGEHRNQHQQATLNRLRHLPGVYPISRLSDASDILSDLAATLNTDAKSTLASGFDSGGADPRLLAMVDGFIREASERG